MPIVNEDVVKNGNLFVNKDFKITCRQYRKYCHSLYYNIATYHAFGVFH